jgi:hypothetical protein
VVVGPDHALVTLGRQGAQACANATLRSENNSGLLADCRAYELVTPADLRGAQPFDEGSSWVVASGGAGAGESVGFFLQGATLPGADGNGVFDLYRTTRSTSGWSTEIFGPNFTQAGGGNPIPQAGKGTSPDLLYNFWKIDHDEASLPVGNYLRSPGGGFELIGQGSLGSDPAAIGRLISRGAQHVIFTSAVQLEPNAPAAPVGAIYDRSPGSPTQVLSLSPAGASPSVQDEFEADEPVYEGASEEGTAVLFKVGSTLYLRRGGQTIPVVEGPSTYAGVTVDGRYVFYADKEVAEHAPGPANILVFDADNGSTTRIAPNSDFVNVAADGSHVFFTSTEVLDGAGKGTAGAHNLYVWDGTSIRLIGELAGQDLAANGFPTSGVLANLTSWASRTVIGPEANGITGIANDPSRTTPGGTVFIFQSHANLTGFDAGGHSEIYRYDSGSQQVTCISCRPNGTAPSGDASLEVYGNEFGSPIDAKARISNVTDDGQRVFFVSEDQLLPEDTNHVRDVYEWRAPGQTGCVRSEGCISLISSGQSDKDSFLYGMTDDGHDVFFTTIAQLIGSDIPGSFSIYDARVDGGFPNLVSTTPCQGDACQGQGSTPPALPVPGSNTISGAGNVPPPANAKKKKHNKHKKKGNKHKKKGEGKKKGKNQAGSGRAKHNRRNSR